MDCPLIDANTVLQKHSGGGLKSWILLQLMRIGGYKADGMQPIDSVKKLAGLPLHIVYHGQTYDQVIGHDREDEYCALLAELFPQTVFIRGDDGGHNHTHETLAKTIHVLRKNRSHNAQLAAKYAATHNGIGTIFTADQLTQFFATRDLYRKPLLFRTV